MESFPLTKQQSQEIAKVITGDVKAYALTNFERFLPYCLNDIRKAKGKPPLEPIIVERNLCDFCD